MKKIRIILLLIILGLVFIFLFMPRQYNVEPFKERIGTQYWNLKTGSRIGYLKIETIEPEKKSPIIYLHGGPGGRIKDQVIKTLKPLSKLGHDLYFYDQIGSGHSDRLVDIGAYSVNRHKRDLREIISKIGSNKTILIGHSWGAVLAVNYLQDYGESIEKIILSGPGPILPINRNALNEIAPDSLQLIEPEYSNVEGNKKAYNCRSKLTLKWAYLFNRKLASDHEADNFFTHLCQELNKSTDCKLEENKRQEGGGGYYSHIMTVKSIQSVENKREKLKKSDTPILILRGQCDNQKWGFTKEYLDIFSNSKLEIIQGVGHDLISKKDKEYFKLINEFIKEK